MMSNPNQSESQQRQESSGSGRGFLWALGGVALAGAGVAALLYFTEKADKTGPNVTLVEDQLRENVREIFRTRNVSQEDCTICLDPLKSVSGASHTSFMLKCGHVFHQACIETWWHAQEKDGHSHNCPSCRATE